MKVKNKKSSAAGDSASRSNETGILIPEKNGAEVSHEPDQMKLLRYFIDSKLLPAHVKTPEQALTIVEIGREIGLPRIASLRTIILINGMPTVTPAMMLALAHKRGLVADYKLEKTDTKATFTFLRKGMITPHVETFTAEDAVKLGLAGKDNYRKQPKVMYAWRAVSATMRIVCPDVIFGLYTPEEMGATIRLDPNNELDGGIVDAGGDEGNLLAMLDTELTKRTSDAGRDAYIKSVTRGAVADWATLKVAKASWMDRALALILSEPVDSAPRSIETGVESLGETVPVEATNG